MEEAGNAENQNRQIEEKYAEHEIPHPKYSLGYHTLFDCKLDDFERVISKMIDTRITLHHSSSRKSH